MMTPIHPRGHLKALFTGSLVLISLLLTSCSMASVGSTATTLVAGNNGKGCMRVGVLLPDTTSSTRWENNDRPALISDIQAAIPGAHVDYNNAFGNSATQFDQAEKDMQNGDCILVVAPHDSIAATDIVEAAKAQNVPVIAYDRLIQSKDLSYYVSFDNVQVGALQAEYIRTHYQDTQFARPDQTTVKIAMINGSQTDTNALLFSIGVHSVLDPMFANGELDDVYETFTPDWNNSTALTEMETYLSSNNNDIQVAYVANDGMASSVMAALKTAKLVGKVLVTGQDATAAGVNSILAGNQSMTVYKPIAQEAKSVGDLIKAIHDGTSTQYLTQGKATVTYDDGSIPSILDTPISVDINNINSTVIKDGYLTRQEICQGIAPNTAGVC